MKRTQLKLYIKVAVLFVLAVLAGEIFFPAYSRLAVKAEEAMRSTFDQTKIEDDLKGVDLSAYPKVSSGRHRLISEAGFTEYAYSDNEEIAEKYYGVYFYVYNPSEREISTEAGANKVNIAVRYNAAGEPLSYANMPITLLSSTSNNRFCKFKIADSAALYPRVRDYANLHEGERRYDIASLQLWYKGDRNATDEAFHDGTYEYARTFFFTGFSKGCGANPEAESNLQVRVKEMESVKLDVKHTFYRSQTSANGGQNQLDTVYFSVSDDLFGKYGKLQRIKAEWYEYKTREILVAENPKTAELFSKIVGYAIPEYFSSEKWEDLRELLSDEEYRALRKYVAAMAFPNNGISFPTVGDKLYYAFATKEGANIKTYDPYGDELEGSGGISSNVLQEYIYNYTATAESGYLQVGDKRISADLFEEDIDERRKVDNEAGKIQCGYSYYDFDIDADLQEMISWKDGEHSKFVEWFYKTFGIYPTEESREFAPIYILQADDLIGTEEAIADKLMIQVSEVTELKRRYRLAQTRGEQIVMFRFAVSNYTSSSTVTPYDAMANAYCAQQSVFLAFDIIQLTFNQEGILKVISVVSNPIDIVGAVTPSQGFTTAGWWDNVTDYFGRLFTGNLEWWEWLVFFLCLPLIVLVLVLAIVVILGVVWIIKSFIKLIISSCRAVKATGKLVKGNKKRKGNDTE